MMNHYYYNQGRSSMGQEGSVWVFLSPSQITHKRMLHKKLTPISPPPFQMDATPLVTINQVPPLQNGSRRNYLAALSKKMTPPPP